MATHNALNTFCVGAALVRHTLYTPVSLFLCMLITPSQKLWSRQMDATKEWNLLHDQQRQQLEALGGKHQRLRHEHQVCLFTGSHC